MLISLLVLYAAISATATTQTNFNYLSPEDKCIASIRKEITDRKVSRNLGGIVGIGWDSLRNEQTLPVFATTYNLCRTVPDGDFLIPDNVVVFPIKEANIQKSSSIHESFSAFKNSDGGKLEVSAGGGVPGIAEVSGSMSVETKIGKEHMEKSKKTCFINTVEYRAFDLIANENAGFDKTFTDRLKEIVIAINQGNQLLAQYEAESIIADYGTHVTNRAKAGASIKMLTFATMTSSSDKSAFALKTSAEFKASVVGIADMGTKAEYEHKKTQQNGVKDISSESYIITKGGPDVNRLLANDGANKMSIDSVVGLTRGGIDLYSVIHRGALKDHDFDNATILLVQDMLYNATQEYYRRNMIPGCTDSDAVNYFYKANVNNNLVCLYPREEAFAYSTGFYQECEYVSSHSDIHSKLKNGSQCEQYRRLNPINQEYKCGNSVSQKKVAGTFYVTFKHRMYSAFVNGCNSTDCGKNYTITDKIKVTTYYCIPNTKWNSEKNKYVLENYYGARIFGGIFEHENIFSDNKRCADGFAEYPFFNNLKICLESGWIWDGIEKQGVAFGGMISCHDENQECDNGLNRMFLTTIDNCPYYQCASIITKDIVNSPATVQKPPYTDRDLAMSKTRFSYRHELEELEKKSEYAYLENGDVAGEILS
uniref:Macrophage-expressed gene 1 protein n=1 Tax=Panagrolaimus sp. PS1159 TaxID=55785 RepID=A0AC35F9P1_9BILA